MPTGFVYPSSAEIEQIAQDKMPRLIANRPIFDLLPTRDVDAHLLKWEQLDNYQGLQQVRGLDGNPGRVAKSGANGFLMEPGTYGEFEKLDEKELTERRQYGTFGTPIDIANLVMEKQDKLLQRRLDRIEYIGWTLLQSGTFSISNADGIVKHTDTYPVQTYSAAYAWSNVANATPLADLRAVQLKHRGHSVNFGATATAYMNRVQWNNLISNANANDLYGRRQEGLGLINNINDFNRLTAGDDLPQVQIYDEGYISDGQDGNSQGTFIPFIPNGKIVVVGSRPAGQVVGEYRYTRNANNANLAPGPYMRVIDRGEHHIPRTIEIHDGHNGGPVIFFPSAIVTLSA